MSRRPPIAPTLLGFALAVLISGCGGATKTVTAASAPLPESTSSTDTPQTTTSTTTTTKPTTPATTPTSTAPAPGANSGGTSPSTTRTAPAPAFTEGSGGASAATTEGLGAAEAAVRARGFSVSSTSEYHPSQTLRVLLGSRSGSTEGNGMQAFFFVDGHYIGTDTKQPSAQLHVVAQSDTEVALAYGLSSGAQATVHFQLNNGKLVPLGAIPSASSRE